MLSRRSGMENFHSFFAQCWQSVLQQEGALTEVLLHFSLVDMPSPSRVYPLARRASLFYSRFRPCEKVDYTSYSYLGVFAVGRQIFTCLILLFILSEVVCIPLFTPCSLPSPVPSFSARKGGLEKAIQEQPLSFFSFVGVSLLQPVSFRTGRCRTVRSNARLKV